MGAAASIGINAAQGYMAGESGVITANYNKRIGDANANMLELQAERVAKKGDKEALRFGEQVNKTVGSQRAALAAQGIDVNDGSALDIQEETMILGARDAQQIKTNAYLEALGMKSQATNMRLQGEFGVQAAENAKWMSVLTGGIKVSIGFNLLRISRA